MDSAPLQLKYYFVTDLLIKARHDYNLEKDRKYDIKDFHSDIKYSKKKEYPRIRQVSLKLLYKPQKNDNMPYEFNINVIGFFEISSKLPESEVENMVGFNAPAMLYSAAREIIANISGRGPWGPFLLPTVSFMPQKSKKSKKHKPYK
jgi:preprotein translocase subunit SecB